ncbi:MAG: GIY-YIG nuclease family protein [Patescibacteria group bacterium]
MFYVYILKSLKDSKLYIGCCSNLRLRFRQHNDGEVVSTKHRRPFVLIYYEAYKNKEVAFGREKLLKHSGKAYTALKKRLLLF